MPGIITHRKILDESINFLSLRKKKSFLLKSLKTLFNSDEFYRAALFGAMGPDIFDFIPKRDKKNIYGNKISFFMHNGGVHKVLASMINKIYSYDDKNIEWAGIQRAYLYGLISHAMGDSIFYPFIFYWSGFPDSYNKNEIMLYREQNLLFLYNIDNYFLYSGEKSDFNIESMFFLNNSKGRKKLHSAVKIFLLESIAKEYPEIYKEIVWKEDKNDKNNYLMTGGYLDILPSLIKAAFRLKRNNNRRIAGILKFLKKRIPAYSDFLIRYPDPREINDHVLNLHRERWQYPAGKPGIHYESVENLLKISCEKTVEIWEKIEASMWGKNDRSVIESLRINLFTGEKKAQYHDMKIKNPVRLYFRDRF